MTSPISHIFSRAIGTVESVSPDEISVLLNTDSPKNTALNTGVPTSFPRINSFVLLPNETGAVVGIVVWLGIERSTYPQRQGFKDSGLIDLPFPLRKMVITPIGTLTSEKDKWLLERGVHSFPSVGDNVILPTQKQTIAIVTGHGKDCRVKLGTCPTAHDASITVDPDKLFGRHLAVIGNTGSGKSCTLAALIRSSIESVQSSIQSEECSPDETRNTNPNARFIILDPNGEYSHCFQDLASGCRVFQVPPLSNTDIKEFVLPAWMWNSAEWAAVAQAAPRVQKPILQTALRDLRSGSSKEMNIQTRILGRCRIVYIYLKNHEGKGTVDWKEHQGLGSLLESFAKDLPLYIKKSEDTQVNAVLGILNEKIVTILSTIKSEKYFGAFSDTDIAFMLKKLESVFEVIDEDVDANVVSEDMPARFDVSNLADYLEIVANQQGGNTNQFIATMVMRIRAMLSDARMKGVVEPESSPTLEKWLENHIGFDQGKHGPITIIDLSLVPYEILHLIIAVSSRLIFESLQRYRKLNSKILPTILVLEEAHTFVAKRFPHGDEIPSPADMCRSVFERIAREGRKFGLGLVLSSQRPSELSETVLSQCNSFLLHRITNDRDQELVNRLVPDTARGLLKELPSLPTRHCILLGIASKIPVLIEVRHLEKGQRPESEDPDFWDVWTLKNERSIDWKNIADNWIGKLSTGSEEVDSTEDS